MQVFLDFIEENPKLRNIFEQVSTIEGHQGNIIYLSSVFLAFQYLTETGKSDDFIDNFFYSHHRYVKWGIGSDPHFLSLPLSDIYSSSHIYDSKIELSDIRKFQMRIPENLDKSDFSPFEVIISIFNDAEKKSFERILKEYSNDNDFTIVIEKRNRNVLLNSKKSHDPLIGGISISEDKSNVFGTLGGFLKDKNGEIFGVTCAHVFKSGKPSVLQPALYDSQQKTRKIGDVVFCSEFMFSNLTASCNPQTSQGNMDLALIKIKDEECEFGIHKLGKVSGMKEFNQIYQGMNVEFNGRSTNKRKQLVIGGLCVSYKVVYEVNSKLQYACFTNLIELRNKSPKKIAFLGNYYITKPPAKDGDSGAWICSNDSKGYNWCGMLISGDLDRAYFLPSGDIMNWVTKNTNLVLDL